MTDRKKPTAGFWITMALVAVLVYPLSFGPACWLATWRPSLTEPVGYAFWPLTRLAWTCLGDDAFLLLLKYGACEYYPGDAALYGPPGRIIVMGAP